MRNISLYLSLLLGLLSFITTGAYAESKGNVIYYTTTDGSICTPSDYSIDPFDANIISNTYEDGQGIITFDSDITRIGDKAFYQDAKLASITIPSGVTSIGDYAFFNCYSIASLTIPSGVTSIGNYAFAYCSKIASLTIPSSVTSIGDYAFYICSSIASISIPKTVTHIGVEAFRGTGWWNNQSDGLIYLDDCLLEYRMVTLSGTLNIKEGTRLIADRVFACCRQISAVYMPSSVKSIGKSAFEGCSSLTSVKLPSPKITDLGERAFAACPLLTSFEFGDSLKSIPTWAFGNCSSLRAISIPKTVTEIGDGAFYGCKKLSSITIPDNVKRIGNSAFSGCSLGSINIPSSVTAIGEGAFIYTPWWDNQPGGLVYKDNCLLGVNYTGATIAGNLDIEEGTRVIASRALYRYSKISSITIPRSVVHIGRSPFAGCSGLKSIVVDPENKIYDSRDNCNAIIETATDCLIQGCYKTSIPNTVTSIGDNAFEELSTLSVISIPSNVTRLGANVFYECKSVKSVICSSTTPPVCDDDCFNGLASNAKLYVPYKSICSYKIAPGWERFKEFGDIANGIDTPTVLTKRSGKYLKDGKVTILRNGREFNVSGFEELSTPKQ